MKNSFGTSLAITIFGESHGPAVGVIMDGIAPGIEINMDMLAAEMDKRRAVGAISTARSEADEVEFISGLYDGYTAGTPLCLQVRNNNIRSADYLRTEQLLRPGHADYTATQKYLGYADPRGGGHFSGRLTAPLVAAGAICRQILMAKNIVLGTQIQRCAGINDKPLPTNDVELRGALHRLNQKQFATLSSTAEEKMKTAILVAKKDGDSVGGILQTVVVGMPAGIGEPFFESMESVLAALFFSIPGVKGVEFGAGAAFADMRGSEANDRFIMRGNNVVTDTNNNGGINGGITNGMPLVIRSVIKPTPSISKEQNTVDYITKTESILELKGRHDPCVLHRARAVADAVTAIGLVDLLSGRYGTLWQREEGHGKV